MASRADGLNIGSLKYYAKQDNETAYNLYYAYKNILKFGITDDRVSDIIIPYIKPLFQCVYCDSSSKWYAFNGTRWVRKTAKSDLLVYIRKHISKQVRIEAYSVNVKDERDQLLKISTMLQKSSDSKNLVEHVSNELVDP